MSPVPLRVKVYTDGGSRGNPGPAAAGLVVFGAGGEILCEQGLFLGEATNNVAEYSALVAALKASARLGADEVDLFSDSELMVRQMNGKYRVRNAGLQPLFTEARGLADQFARFTISHVRRDGNKHADDLVNQALDMRRNVGGWKNNDKNNSREHR